MHLIILLIVFVALAAIIIWVAEQPTLKLIPTSR